MPRLLTLRYPGHDVRSRLSIDRGGLARLGRFARRLHPGSRALVVTDRRVGALYGARALGALRAAGWDASLLALPPGERTKRPALLERAWHACAAAGLGRGDLVVALGGGVVGDLAGFAAATWLRGVAWIGVPTTLLAQVDSSVGGKTGVDLPEGKNLVGAFHQPAGVLVDPALLETLPARQFRAGLAEVVKVGAAADRPLFAWLERHAAALAAREGRAVEEAVLRAIRAKARVVMADEREREGGARAALNFGHTLGHAIEAARGYRGILHGEAVAIGMRAAARLSVAAGAMPESERARLVRLLDAFRLPARVRGVTHAALLAAMRHDKKRSASGVRWVLTTQIGHASVPRLISGRLLRAALIEVGARV